MSSSASRLATVVRSASLLKLSVGIGALWVAIGVTAVALSAHAAGTTQTSAIPQLMLSYGGGWRGSLGPGMTVESYLPADYLHGSKNIQAAIRRGVPPDKVSKYLDVKTHPEFIPPESGLGPMPDDPDHPYFENLMKQAIGKDSTYRVADLNSSEAKNLMPWAFEALKKQDALALAGKNGETRMARCWQTGVPDFHEGTGAQILYFIQTPAEVVMILGPRVRHVYMNVPHSKNPTPSWYGESVGHYEGDTLVVDTIGQNDKTFVDGYRTPHTTQLHVVERFRVVSGGKALDTSFTVDDPGTFYKPWSGRRPRSLITNYPLNEDVSICAAGNDDKFNLGLDLSPHTDKPDF